MTKRSGQVDRSGNETEEVPPSSCGSQPLEDPQTLQGRESPLCGRGRPTQHRAAHRGVSWVLQTELSPPNSNVEPLIPDAMVVGEV